MRKKDELIQKLRTEVLALTEPEMWRFAKEMYYPYFVRDIVIANSDFWDMKTIRRALEITKRVKMPQMTEKDKTDEYAVECVAELWVILLERDKKNFKKLEKNIERRIAKLEKKHKKQKKAI